MRGSAVARTIEGCEGFLSEDVRAAVLACLWGNYDRFSEDDNLGDLFLWSDSFEGESFWIGVSSILRGSPNKYAVDNDLAEDPRTPLQQAGIKIGDLMFVQSGSAHSGQVVRVLKDEGDMIPLCSILVYEESPSAYVNLDHSRKIDC